VKKITQLEAEVAKCEARRTEIVRQAELDDIHLPKSGADSYDLTGLGARPKTQADFDKQEDKYLASIKDLSAQLEAMAPNTRAEAKLEEAVARLKDSDAVLQEAKDAETKFAKVRQQRHDKFMAMFTKVSECIDFIYKQLTKREGAPMGGSAFLALEDAGGNEPFLAGVKYDVSPPNKRFRPMDQLSGGEKTVAALALLFAVHAFRPSPFFVMDEVDAALDNDNVARVANYIRQRSRRGEGAEAEEDAPPVQCLVISLKDNFYDRADALVGVYREIKEDSSKCLTLDLSKYEM
jgi:structural maintenance of chromosome 1